MRRGAATLAALLLLAACGDGRDGLDRAARVLGDDDRFSTSIDAGEALAEVADLLLDGTGDCERGCETELRAAAFARVLAVRVLGCTAPGRQAARAAMRDHLEAVRAGEAEPAAPPMPSCPSPR